MKPMYDLKKLTNQPLSFAAFTNAVQAALRQDSKIVTQTRANDLWKTVKGDRDKLDVKMTRLKTVARSIPVLNE